MTPAKAKLKIQATTWTFHPRTAVTNPHLTAPFSAELGEAASIVGIDFTSGGTGAYVSVGNGEPDDAKFVFSDSAIPLLVAAGAQFDGWQRWTNGRVIA